MTDLIRRYTRTEAAPDSDVETTSQITVRFDRHGYVRRVHGDFLVPLLHAAGYTFADPEDAAALRSAPVANDDDQHGDYCGQEHPPTENCIGPGFECGYCGAPPAVRPEDLDHTPGSSRPCTECAPDAGHNAGRPISQVHCDACGGWGHHTPSCPI